MTDIIERLLQVQGDNEDAREAVAEIRRQQDDYTTLKIDYDILRDEYDVLCAEVEQLRSALGAIAELDVWHKDAETGKWTDVSALARAALEPKP